MAPSAPPGSATGGYSRVNFGHPKSEVFQNGGGGWGTLPSQNSKFQDQPKFQFSGEGGLCQVKTQSSKICLNFNLGGGVLYCSESGALSEF